VKNQFPDDECLKYVNCAYCGREMLGESCRDYWRQLDAAKKSVQPVICARVDGRPYCSLCMKTKRFKPWQDVIILQESDPQWL
jgi:hypothetical protein